MTDGQRFVLLIARMVDLLRSKPGGVDEAKEVLRSLSEMTIRQSWTVRLKGSDLVIEGVAVPASTPPMPALVTQMNVHGVSEIQMAQGVATPSLMHLLRALAVNADGFESGDGVGRRLTEAKVGRIHVLGPEDVEEADQGRTQRVTDAMRVPGAQESEGQGEEAPVAAPRDSKPVPPIPPLSIEELIEQIRTDRVSLGAAAKRMRGLKAGPQLTAGLDALAGGVGKAVRGNRNEDAIDAILSVIRQE